MSPEPSWPRSVAAHAQAGVRRQAVFPARSKTCRRLLTSALGNPAAGVVSDPDQAIVQLFRRRGTLLEHPVEELQDAVANDLLIAGKPAQTGVAGEQRTAGAVRQGQGEGIG